MLLLTLELPIGPPGTSEPHRPRIALGRMTCPLVETVVVMRAGLAIHVTTP